MAVRSVIDIQINDGKFASFKRLFDQYQSALKSQPAAWAAVTAKIDGTKASFDKAVGAMVAQNVQARLLEKAQERADHLSQTWADRWSGIARSTREFAGNITHATFSLLRWASISGIVSGLAGAGGIFGIDRMAHGVAASRRSALGLNVGYGEKKAFEANFARFVDPESFLSAVAGARTDATQRTGLMAAGVPERDLDAKDTAQTAVALIRRLKVIADTMDPKLFGDVIRAYKLEHLTSPEDLMRLRNTPRGELADVERRYRGNIGDFSVPADVTRGWQEFVTQMARAGQGIENTFVRALAPLTPSLTKLSESFETVIRTFLGSPVIKGWLTDLDGALQKFATYVGKPEFQKDVESFVEGIGKLASGIAKIVKWLTDWGPKFDPKKDATEKERNAWGDLPESAGQAKFNGWMNHIVKPPEWAASLLGGPAAPGAETAPAGPAAAPGGLPPPPAPASPRPYRVIMPVPMEPAPAPAAASTAARLIPPPFVPPAVPPTTPAVPAGTLKLPTLPDAAKPFVVAPPPAPAAPVRYTAAPDAAKDAPRPYIVAPPTVPVAPAAARIAPISALPFAMPERRGGEMGFETLLGMVRKLEGSGDREISHAGAVGRYQVTPDTARTYGADPSRLMDPQYNEAVARRILADLIRRYHGKTDEILAAYNAGPGRANRFRAAGDDPRTLPGETQRYITRARGLDGYSPAVVTIENVTGGNAVVSINGLR